MKDVVNFSSIGNNLNKKIIEGVLLYLLPWRGTGKLARSPASRSCPTCYSTQYIDTEISPNVARIHIIFVSIVHRLITGFFFPHYRLQIRICHKSSKMGHGYTLNGYRKAGFATQNILTCNRWPVKPVLLNCMQHLRAPTHLFALLCHFCLQ